MFDPSSHLASFPTSFSDQLSPSPKACCFPSHPSADSFTTCQKVILGSQHSSIAALLIITTMLLAQSCPFCLPLDPLSKIGRESVHVPNNSIAVLAAVRGLMAVLYMVYVFDPSSAIIHFATCIFDNFSPRPKPSSKHRVPFTPPLAESLAP